MNIQHPKTWWFRLAEVLVPDRCREVPEAYSTQEEGEPPILLRQVAVVPGRVYLQQFASGEDPAFMHSHPWASGTIAIGLWGSVEENLLTGPRRHRTWSAPYFRFMGPNFLHRSVNPSPGHTSIFIGLGEKTDEKHYVRSAGRAMHWRDHIKKIVRPGVFK